MKINDNIYKIDCLLTDSQLKFTSQLFIIKDEDKHYYYLCPLDSKYLDQISLEKKDLNKVLNTIPIYDFGIGFEYSCYTTKENIINAKIDLKRKIEKELDRYTKIIKNRKNILNNTTEK